MLDKEYPGEDASIEEIKDLLLQLTTLGSKKVVITGVNVSNGLFGFIGYDTENKTFFEYGTPKVPYKSHGTGDVFSSTFTGALMNNFSIFDSLIAGASSNL